MSRFCLSKILSPRRLLRATAVLALLMVCEFAQSGMAQTPPLNFENNYFVTGDYVVGGVALRGTGVNGYATGTITVPDANTVPSTGVPPGADIVAAFLYWQTVESTPTSTAGQTGYFNGYPMAGHPLGNPNAPESWGSGGCSGSSNGTKTLRTYRADVRSFLKIDPTTGKYVSTVMLADSGSNGSTTPIGLGASLVLIYRVLDPAVKLNSIVIFDGSYAPTNGAQTMQQPMYGFYEADGGAAKLTHIVSSGQTNKYQTVYLNSTQLPSLYKAKNGTALPAFPGYYNSSGATFNGSWDNPTWLVNTYTPQPIVAEASSATTMVVPNSSNSGCVAWGATIVSTTVKDFDNDGLLDAWETAGGYCDAALNAANNCNTTDNAWVPLPQADPGKPDVFVQADYMCSGTINGVCSTFQSDYPQSAINTVTTAFAANGHNVNLHVLPGSAIAPPSCTDNYSVSPPKLCPFPSPSNPPGVVGWKGGFEYLKNQPINTDPSTGAIYTEAACEANPGSCIRRFQHGKKDSYHYMLFGYASGHANWSLGEGTLSSVVVNADNTVTFYTSTPPTKLLQDQNSGFGRVTVGDAITNPNLNGTWLVSQVNPTTVPYSFTVNVSNVPTTGSPYSKNTDPNLSVAMGQAGTSSGVSDIAGQDSLITLGSWGPDGQSDNVRAGTVMHELGHSLGLTHGGYSYPHYNDVPGQPNYTTSFEANCKPNYQSVMNYLFQVDLLDGNVNYSEQELIPISEGSGLNSTNGITALDGSAARYSSTSWFTSTPPNNVGNLFHAATRHCDGTPILDGATYYRLVGPIAPVSIDVGDVNFDGITGQTLDGYSDWSPGHIDFRQSAATGNASVVGGILLGGSGGILLGGSGGILLGGSGGIVLGGSGGILLGGSGGISLGGSGGIVLGGSGGISLGGSGGIGNGEINNEIANSVVRPPTSLTDQPNDTRTSHSVSLSWNVPTFGQIVSYNVYRTPAGTPPPTWPQLAATNSYLDTAVTDCTTYTYFTTALLALQPGESQQRESVGSNSVAYAVPCPIADPLAAEGILTNNAPSVKLTWRQAPPDSGPIYGYNVYRDNGTKPLATVAGASNTSYVDTTVVNSATYTYYVTSLLHDPASCSPGRCGESTQKSVTITVAVKKQQTITFNPIPDHTWGDADFTVSATASSGLTVTYSTTTSSYCTVSGNTVHLVHAGTQACTITASQGGNDQYYAAPDVSRTFTINQANAIVTVTTYNVTYDGNAHTATGTATGAGIYSNDSVGVLDLSGTTHTNANTYTDTWQFSDPATGSYPTGNYVAASAQVTDIIKKATPTVVVTGYNVPYDGKAHTATGTATGVKGESLVGLNLSGTTHTNAGNYTDSWTFTDVTGNYLSPSGTVYDVITKSNTVLTITSIKSNPAILGQSFTVSFSMTPASGPTGSVTVSDASGVICSVDLPLSGGAGSCSLTLPVLNSSTNLAIVGFRTLTVAYVGDSNFNGTSASPAEQVIYKFSGFLSPLKGGSYKLGKALPIKWQLQTYSGAYITINNINLNFVRIFAYWNGLPTGNKCPPAGASTTFVPLYSPSNGTAGNSTFRYDSTSNQFVFNWDTTVNAGAGCYTLSLQLDDGTNNMIQFQLN